MNPLLVMALLSAASTAANYQGQKKVDKGRAAAMQADLLQRQKQEQRSTEASNSTLDILANANKAAKDREAQLAAKYESAAPVPVPTAAPQTPSQALNAGSESTATIDAGSRAAARAKAFTDQQAQSRAALNSFGDVMVDNSIAAGRNANTIQRAGIAANDWTRNVLPGKLAVANNAGKSWNTIADVLQLASAIYGPIGLSKGAGAGAGLKAAYDVSTTAPAQGGVQSALRYV